MAVVLVRIDDRLIHGQVVEGWLPVVQAQRIVVVSDRAAADPLQVGLMKLAVPETVTVDVHPVRRAVDVWCSTGWPKERVMVLFPSVAEFEKGVEAGAPVTELNLGGVHDGPGRVPVAPNLALHPDERRALTRLVKRGIRIDTRALPMDDPRFLPTILPEVDAP